MKTLVIVTESPWGSSLGVTALRLVRALAAGGDTLCAVFFREEGVYRAQAGRANDAGTPNLNQAWDQFSANEGVPLLVCSSASQRRLGLPPEGRFKEAGLAQMMELLKGCDRVVTL